jgi:hypothetical protein
VAAGFDVRVTASDAKSRIGLIRARRVNPTVSPSG